MTRINSPEELQKRAEEILSARDPKKPCITLCSGTACHATGSEAVATAIKTELEKQGLDHEVDFRRTGCHGFCEKGPIVVIYPDEICYLQVAPEDVPEIATKTLIEKQIIDGLLYVDPTTGEKIALESDIPFYKYQERLVLGANKKIDP
jgi:NADH-quinone oxidoreductase subunit F